ncbi:hypothetical protein [Actinophytocola sp.]|uniref:hypothetical protein n=1 Tax=Actinophytocola sp. TaxID=1872138 RepID=UPI002D7EE367|nr:hypothetical protein [Actinophytocola sp.]HET9142460.1 hypothetical protein [Actinophytocola sp.]
MVEPVADLAKRLMHEFVDLTVTPTVAAILVCARRGFGPTGGRSSGGVPRPRQRFAVHDFDLQLALGMLRHTTHEQLWDGWRRVADLR